MPLKVQLVQIWENAIGLDHAGRDPRVYSDIVKILCHEYGVFSLMPAPNRIGNSAAQLRVFFLTESTETEECLDVVELVCRVIDKMVRKPGYFDRFGTEAADAADAALEEINARFQEHGIGYQYADNEILRVDSQLIHSEVVKPALKLLNSPEFSGAQQEFLTAHAHYRTGKQKEALNECLKAIESLTKAICDKRGWTYKPSAAAKDLIEICFVKGLIPQFWQTQFSALRSLLESGVPTGRNKLSGHGQGAVPTIVPNYLVGYMLHMTAACIVFLAEAESDLP